MVQARNLIGLSAVSTPNTGFAEIRTEPKAPLTTVTKIAEESSDSSIAVFFANIEKSRNGGSPVLSLSLFFDQGND